MVEIQRDPEAFARKAVAPIFSPDGSHTLRFKAVRSKWETDLRLHEEPQEPIELELQGIRVKVQVLVCIEALHLGVLRQDAELLVIPASTPQIGPFETLFSQLLLNEVPSVIANSAIYGGSQFALRGPTVPGDLADLLKLIPSEEALIVTDVELRAQAQKRQTARVHPSSQLLARRPFLYASVAEQAALIEFQLKTKRQGMPRPKSDEVRELVAEASIPVLMRQQLEMLATALEQGSATQDDLMLLLDSLPLPGEVVPFWNRCYQCLEEASRAAAALLPDNPVDAGIPEAITAISRGMRAALGRQLPLAIRPAPLREASPRTSMPFFNRDIETNRLRNLLAENPAILVYGLPGIGKKTLVEQVLGELYPRHFREALQCVGEMKPGQLLAELSARLGFSLDRLRRLSPHEKDRMHRIIVVRDLQEVDLHNEDSRNLLEYLELLRGSNSRIVCLATKQLDIELASLSLGSLPPEHTARVFDYFCRLLGVDAMERDEIRRQLWGYPLAARTAATLLAERREQAFERLRFFGRLRSEVAKILLASIELTQEEAKVLEALSVFRRPVPEGIVDRFQGHEPHAVLEELEKKFLVSREGGELFVIPLIRDVATEEWFKKGPATAHHKRAAEFYKEGLRSGDAIRRFECLEEAIYHLSSINAFDEARSLGVDWGYRARAAAKDLYRRGGYKESLAICERLLESKKDDREVLTRAVLCAAKLRMWPRGRVLVAMLKELGEPPVNALTGFGEALVRYGAPSEGQTFIEEALLYHPNDAYSKGALADIHLKARNMRLARNLVEEALDDDPESTRALEVASTLERLEGNPEQAYRYAQRLMKINPRQFEQVYQKARSALRKKHGGDVPPELLSELES